jgi:hypothetical protein
MFVSVAFIQENGRAVEPEGWSDNIADINP